MASITIRTPEVSQNVKTYLSREYLSGTTLYVDSSVSFSNGNYIIVGEPGQENTEITYLTSAPASDTTMAVSSLKFSHSRGTQIYSINWDKYSLEYIAATGDTWTAYSGMPLDLRYDANYTEYRDSASTSTYQWRYRYYSTEKTAYSDYSDTITSTGWPKNSVGYMVRDVRKIINDPDSKTVSDTEIIRYFNTAQDKIYTLYDRWFFLLKVGSAITTTASGKTYNLPSDFGRMHSVLYRYVSGSTDISYNLRYLPMVEYEYESRDNNASAEDEIKYWTIYPGDSTNETGYLYVWPKPSTAGLSIYPKYYKTMTALDTYGDKTEVPLPAMLVDYALGEIYKIRGEETKATYYDKLFREQVELLKLMQRKQVGQPRYLWKYQGRRADEKLFGNQSISSDSDVENYW